MTSRFATSSDTTTTTRTFTITIGDADEFDVSTPTDSDAATNEVDENLTIGTTVGITANALDLDATTNTVTYSLTSNADGLFHDRRHNGRGHGQRRDQPRGGRQLLHHRASHLQPTARPPRSTFTITINDVDEFDTGAVSDTNARGQCGRRERRQRHDRRHHGRGQRRGRHHQRGHATRCRTTTADGLRSMPTRAS